VDDLSLMALKTVNLLLILRQMKPLNERLLTFLITPRNLSRLAKAVIHGAYS